MIEGETLFVFWFVLIFYEYFCRLTGQSGWTNAQQMLLEKLLWEWNSSCSSSRRIHQFLHTEILNKYIYYLKSPTVTAYVRIITSKYLCDSTERWYELCIYIVITMRTSVSHRP